MKGSTNSVVKGKSEVENVNLTLKTDQSSHSVLVGAVITVSYGDYSKDYTWGGTAITIEVPAYVEYTISFGAVSGYTAPSSISYTAQANNSRTVTATYTIEVEKLTVKVSGLSSGFTVSVINATTGATIGTQTATSKVYSIPAGTKYYVIASAYSGYNTPANSSTYTAVANGTRTVTMTYTVEHSGTTSPSNGVYIQDTDGYFHTESEWDGSYTPNGIAVITSNCRFVMALSDAHSTYCQWGSYGTEVSGITTATDISTAKTDYDGEAQTTTILSVLGNSSDTDDAPAAYYCRAYTFPDGKKGYLGAAGEWQAALDNKAAVASALSKCGGTALSDYYWTSTQYSSNHSWAMYWNYEYLTNSYKRNDRYVRAFAAI